jgi:hypothetical protein
MSMKSSRITFGRVNVMQTRVLGLACAALLFGNGLFAQTIAEFDSAMSGMEQLDGAGVGSGNTGYVNRAYDAAAAANANAAGFPGTAPFPNTAAGFPPPPTTGMPGTMPGMPGMPAVTPMAGYPGLSAPAAAQPGMYGQPGAYNPYGQPYGQQQMTPTPLPTIKVLVGKRVTCAVCGALLEDAVQLDVLQTDQDKYLDDGIHDNGIANDGVRGNVETLKNVYIGPECNGVKNRLVNVVRQAENFTPMEFYRYHVMALDPITAHPRMPNVLDREEQQDEALRDWNNKFLADYRVDKTNPQSEFYQLYVPDPPQVPRYPVPPGYVSPQQLREGTQPGQPAVAPAPNIYNGDPVMMEGLI